MNVITPIHADSYKKNEDGSLLKALILRVIFSYCVIS